MDTIYKTPERQEMSVRFKNHVGQVEKWFEQADAVVMNHHENENDLERSITFTFTFHLKK